MESQSTSHTKLRLAIGGVSLLATFLNFIIVSIFDLSSPTLQPESDGTSTTPARLSWLDSALTDAIWGIALTLAVLDSLSFLLQLALLKSDRYSKRVVLVVGIELDSLAHESTNPH